MILLVDIGNTNLKWACLKGRRLTDSLTVRYHNNLPGIIEEEWSGIEQVSEMLISNVTGSSIEEVITSYAQSRWGISPQYIHSSKNAYGVSNAYCEPNRLGVDRWLALIASHDRYKMPVLIVDAGTATTIDGITASGEHLGGLILPGLNLMRESLLCETSIPKVCQQHDSISLATDTVQAVSSAAIQATVALIERVLVQLEGKLGETPKLLLTGGDAAILYEEIKCRDGVILDPKLVLKGLLRFSKHREK